jgi:hypothetical protein
LKSETSCDNLSVHSSNKDIPVTFKNRVTTNLADSFCYILTILELKTANQNALPGGPAGPDSPGYPGLPLIPGSPCRPGVPISPGGPCKYTLYMCSPAKLVNSLTVKAVTGMCAIGIKLSSADRISYDLDNVGRVP